MDIGNNVEGGEEAERLVRGDSRVSEGGDLWGGTKFK